MLEREEIGDDWKQWDGRRLAWALEAHFVDKDDTRQPPAWLQKVLDDNEREDQQLPMALGYHHKTGFFVLCSAGQGPAICGIEKIGPPMTPGGGVDVDDEDDDYVYPF